MAECGNYMSCWWSTRFFWRRFSNGGDVQQGFLSGALIGAGSAFLYNLPQAVNNYQDGFGFETNIAAFKNAANEAIEGGIVDNNKANRALDFWMDRFGGPKLYRNKLVPFTDPDNGRIYSTDPAFLL